MTIRQASPSRARLLARLPRIRLSRKKKGVPALIAGPLILILIGAALFTAVKAAYGGFGHYYTVTVDLPRAGQQMHLGSDVRIRGVPVGTVSGIELVGSRARLTLKMEERYKVPASAEAVVALKTLLGAKYVDLRFDRFGGPYLADGGRISTAHVGPELEDALADGTEVLQAIGPNDLATVVMELSKAARGHGDEMARGIEANEQLSGLFARTLGPQIESLRDFNVMFGELKSRGTDLNNLADAINQGVPVYASRQAQASLRAALEALTPFANDFADLLIFNKGDWDRMIDAGDQVLGAIAARPDGLRDLVVGLYRYVFKLGGPPFQAKFLMGSAAAGFVNFIGGDDGEKNRRQICEGLPPEIRHNLPYCDGIP
jgi:phospholipid/cholesterol/gamma-HCH transport system substrate-binding protein